MQIEDKIYCVLCAQCSFILCFSSPDIQLNLTNNYISGDFILQREIKQSYKHRVPQKRLPFSCLLSFFRFGFECYLTTCFVLKKGFKKYLFIRFYTECYAHLYYMSVLLYIILMYSRILCSMHHRNTSSSSHVYCLYNYYFRIV